jgi:hypothetical protein
MIAATFALHLTIASAIAVPVAPPTVANAPAAVYSLPWQTGSSPQAGELGEGVGVVFSPDLATPENRAFYEALGFTYFEASRWTDILRELKRRQSGPRAERMRYLIIESHGANGNGLKVQASPKPEATRSYISLGGLQEAADKLGIETVLISACNSGRLYRPEIYKVLDRTPDDPMFLPPTAGIIDAAPGFDPQRSDTSVLRRKQNGLETLIEGKFSELPVWLKSPKGKRPSQARFVVSTMLIQLVLGDQKLQLTADGFETEKSKGNLTPAQSERLYKRFVSFLSAARNDEAVTTR